MVSSSSHLRLGVLLNSPGDSFPDEALDENKRPINISLPYYIKIAKALEDAKLDFVMVADTVSSEVSPTRVPKFEPVTLFSALASVTHTIGLIPTVSTTFTEPFNLARQILSLDHLSSGRAGWNVVTSSAGEKNFGLPAIPGHTERYKRALEYVGVVEELWTSWQPDAIVPEAGGEVRVEPDRVRKINHRGDYYSVEGPLNLPRSVQDRPVLFQAGSSSDGIDFAARFAEGVYTAQQILGQAQEFYRDLKTRTLHYGRRAEQIAILPGLSTVIGDTEADALRLDREIGEATLVPEVWKALSAQLGGIEIDDLELDRRVPAERLPEILSVQGRQSRYGVFRHFALEEGWTLRQLLHFQATSAGHGRVVGTPEQVADHIEHWFRQKAADGFIVMPGQGVGGAEIFASEVVPILRRRGLYRDEYESATLRGNLGFAETTLP